MSTHNICFYGQVGKISTILGWKKHFIVSYDTERNSSRSVLKVDTGATSDI